MQGVSCELLKVAERESMDPLGVWDYSGVVGRIRRKVGGGLGFVDLLGLDVWGGGVRVASRFVSGMQCREFAMATQG